MKIEQLHMNKHWDHFKDGGTTANRTIPYSDPTAPAFFYSTWAITHILDNHKGPAIIIVNSDPRPIEHHLDKIKLRNNIYFISTSHLTSNYLDELKLKYIEFPFDLPNRTDITPVKKGNSIYFYGQGSTDNLYGYSVIKRIVEEHFPHLNIICTQFQKHRGVEDHHPFKPYSKSELEDVYKKCFIGVRLTQFDGLSATVQDLGVRGIKTIWNGGSPSSLPYYSEEDIINHIRNEEKLIGQTDLALSNSVKLFLDQDNKKYDYVFDLDFHKENALNVHSTTAPRLFKNPYKIPFVSYDYIYHNQFDLRIPITVKEIIKWKTQ